MTKNDAVELMKSRGYTMVSEAGNDSWIGFSKDINGIRIAATVFLIQESVSMCGGTLQLMCKLSTEKFDVNSKRFADFENVLYLYAKICSSIDNLVDAEGIIKKTFDDAKKHIAQDDGVNKGVNDGESDELAARKNKFKNLVISIGKEKDYPPEMCKKFFSYWSETNDAGKFMRWEIAKRKSGVFNVKGRMVTWYGKDKEDMKFKDRDDRKADKQNKELKKKPTVINTKDLF